MESLRIKRGVVLAMLRQAFDELPNECCGLLSGKRGLIDGIRPCQNQQESPTAFSVAPGELFDFFRSLRQEGMEFLGIYHSHPSGSGTPSLRDADEFYYPGVSYWILSLHNGSAGVRCFEWDREGFIEVPYEVVSNDRKIAQESCAALFKIVTWEEQKEE